MRGPCVTAVAALLAIALTARPSSAACPADLEAFEERYRQALTSKQAALSAEEKADLDGLRTAAEALHLAGRPQACTTMATLAASLLDAALAPPETNAEALIGWELTNAAGEQLGEVVEVLIDPTSGRVAYLVVEHGGFLGVGRQAFAVPWGVVRYVGDEASLQVDTGAEHLPR